MSLQQLPPSRPAPNYDDPVSRGPATVLVVAIFLPLTIIIMGGRLFTRAKIVKVVGFDDWLMLAATIVSIPLGVCLVLSNDYGWGRHTWDMRPEWHIPVKKISWSLQLIFVSSASLAKLSILAFYLRIMNTLPTLRILSWTGVFIVTGLWLAFFLICVMACIPLEAYWDPSVPGKCLSQNSAMTANASMNIFTDLYVLVIPISSILSLNLPIRQKISVLLIFALGLTTCLFGILRVSSSLEMSKTSDKSWIGGLLFIFTAMENYLGIICASIPALKPLFTLYYPRFLGTPRHSSMHNSSTGARGGPRNGQRHRSEGGFALNSMDPRFDATAKIEASRPRQTRRKSSSDISEDSVEHLQHDMKNDGKCIVGSSMSGNSSEECFAKDCGHVKVRDEESANGPAPKIGKQVRVEVKVEMLRGSPHSHSLSYGLAEGSAEAAAYNSRNGAPEVPPRKSER